MPFLRLGFFLLALFTPSLALAQATLLHAGNYNTGRAPMYASGGSPGGQPVLIDSGPASGAAPGQGLAELLLTMRGAGPAPYSGTGSGPFGTNHCEYDAPVTNATGYHYLCFSPNATQGGLTGGLITYGAGGTAAPLPLTICVNGVCINPGGQPALTVGVTAILSGGPGRVLYDSGGFISEFPGCLNLGGFLVGTGSSMQCSLTANSIANIAGSVTITNPNAEGLALRSGNNTSFSLFGIGRSADDFSIGVAGLAGQFTAGTVSGDSAVKANTNLWLVAGGATTPSGLEITTNCQSGASTCAILRTNNAANFALLDLGRTAQDFSIGVAASANQFAQGTIAGDAAIKANTNLWLVANGVGTPAGIEIISSASNTSSILRTNSASAFALLDLGRTSQDFSIGVAASANQFTQGTVAGDSAVKANTNLWLQANGVATPAGLEITSSASATSAILRTNSASAFALLDLGRTAQEFSVGVAASGGQFTTGTNAGDAAIKANNRLFLVGGGATTPLGCYVDATGVLNCGTTPGLSAHPSPITINQNIGVCPDHNPVNFANEVWLAQMCLPDSTSGGVGVDVFGGFAVYDFRTAGGTNASPTAVTSGTLLGVIGWLAQYDTTPGHYSHGALQIRGYANQNFTVANQGTYGQLLATANNSVADTIAPVITWVGGGSVGIVNATPKTNLDINLNTTQSPALINSASLLRLQNVDGSASSFELVSYLNGNAVGTVLRGGAAGGTAASPTATPNSTPMLGIFGYGYTGAAWAIGSGIQFQTTELWTTGPHTGSKILFWTVASGGNSFVNSMNLENDGGLTVPPTVTGGSKGAGSGNFTTLFVAGTAVLTGNQTITLSGDVTGSGATAITTTAVKVNGVSYPSGPSTNTVPVVTGSNTVTYETVPVAAGGTGAATFTLNGVLYGNGTSAIQATAQGGANTVLTANAGAPSFSAAPVIGTSVTTPIDYGGSAASSSKTIASTSGAGTTDFIAFQTASQTERMRIVSGGSIGIGSSPSAPQSLLHLKNNAGNITSDAGTMLQLTQADGTSTNVEIESFGTSNVQFSQLTFRAATGTAASPGQTASGQILGFVASEGWTSSNAWTARNAQVRFIAGEALTSSAQGMLIAFITTPTGSTSAAEAARFQPSGGLSVGNATDPAAGGLDLNGQLYVPNITQTSAAQTGTVCWTSGGSPAGKFTVDTTVGCLSSLEEAKDIAAGLDPVEALALIDQLKPFSFRYRRGYGDDGRYEQFGLGAHQVASIDERMVGRDIEGNLHGVRYMELTAVLASAIQKLKADNDNLQRQIADLRSARR